MSPLPIYSIVETGKETEMQRQADRYRDTDMQEDRQADREIKKIKGGGRQQIGSPETLLLSFRQGGS